MSAVTSEKEEISSIVTVCFKSFADILQVINKNSEMISYDEIVHLSKIIPGIKVRLNSVVDIVETRLPFRENEPKTYNSSSNKLDCEVQKGHTSPVNRFEEEKPLTIQNTNDFIKVTHQVVVPHEKIEMKDHVEQERKNDFSYENKYTLPIAPNSIPAPLSHESGIHDHFATDMPRRVNSRTIVPAKSILKKAKAVSAENELSKISTNKALNPGWGKVRRTMFPTKITPTEKRTLLDLTDNSSRRISFRGISKDKEVHFTLSPRRPSNLKLVSDTYDTSNTNWEDMARDAFKIIDLNGDGFLQKQEVMCAIEIMKKSGDMDKHANSAELAETMLSTFDNDGDGQIDIEEFLSLMKNAGKSVVNHRMSSLAHNVLLNHQKKIENSVMGDDVWLIHPLSPGNALWDILVSMLICITVVTMPLSLGWDELNHKFYAMNLTFDFIFLLDVGKNFCTGFVDENDAVIMDQKMVRWNYFTGLFLVDLLGSLPLDLIFKMAGFDGGTVSGTKSSLRLLKFVRMAKLIRLVRLNRLFQQVKKGTLFLEEELHVRISDGFTKLLRLFVGALILAHWIGCFHFYLVRSHDFPLESWIVHAGLDDKEPSVQWTWSFFKALAQMLMIGFETPPFTNTVCDEFTDWCAVEHWVTLGSLYLGAVFYSLLISSISSILATSSLARRRFDEKLIQIDDYMRSKKLPASLREKVKEYFHLQHVDRKLFNEKEIHDMVTPFLSRQIKSFSGREIRTRVPIFSSISNRRFTEEMVNAIEPSVAFTGEVILREDTTGDEMFFISNGVVELYFNNKSQNEPYMAIGDGCYLGEVSLLLDVRRIASARTKTQCMLYKITKKKLLKILQDFPETQEMMKSVAVCRRKRVNNYLDPLNNPLSAEEAVDSEDAKTDIFGANMDEITQEKDQEYKKLRKSFEPRSAS